MQFPVVLHTDDGTHYSVIVPDLPGCFSGGKGIDDALAEAREGIDQNARQAPPFRAGKDSATA